jgi:hypothetical protein
VCRVPCAVCRLVSTDGAYVHGQPVNERKIKPYVPDPIQPINRPGLGMSHGAWHWVRSGGKGKGMRGKHEKEGRGRGTRASHAPLYDWALTSADSRSRRDLYTSIYIYGERDRECAVFWFF